MVIQLKAPRCPNPRATSWPRRHGGQVTAPTPARLFTLFAGPPENAARRECCEKLVLLLAPFAPFAAEELWTGLGYPSPVFKQPWPACNDDLAREDMLEIPVQVNGKLRGKIAVPHGAPQSDIEAAALAEPNVQTHTAGKTIAKLIVVPGKMVNIVVR
jgi:leucyl-tRNA synthetase